MLFSVLLLFRGLSLHFLKCLPPHGNFTEQSLGGIETVVEVMVWEETAVSEGEPPGFPLLQTPDLHSLQCKERE